jgi:hypothetical protein
VVNPANHQNISSPIFVLPPPVRVAHQGFLAAAFKPLFIAPNESGHVVTIESAVPTAQKTKGNFTLEARPPFPIEAWNFL